MSEGKEFRIASVEKRSLECNTQHKANVLGYLSKGQKRDCQANDKTTSVAPLMGKNIQSLSIV